MDAFVARHLKGVSRTYAILIPMLPRELAEPVGLAYLLMRIVDTLEDAPQLSDQQRRECFERLEAALAGREVDEALTRPIGDIGAEHALMRAVPQVVERVRGLEPVYRDAICECSREMMSGARQFLDRSAQRGMPYPAIRNAQELRSYCYYVAGVVGAMLCRMMAHYLKRPALERLRDVAVELGVGLQLVNILKDALKDSRQGRRYLPTATGGRVAHGEIYRAVLNEARLSLQRGVEFVMALPASASALRSFCGLPIAWGAMTLARAERDAGRAKIGRGAISSSIARFKRLATDDQALRRWFATLLRPAKPAADGAFFNPA
jgi:farnesyl-diphosphate farnesyltransferase